MEPARRGVRVRVYLGEHDRHGALLDGGLMTTDPVDIVRYTPRANKPRDRPSGGAGPQGGA